MLANISLDLDATKIDELLQVLDIGDQPIGSLNAQQKFNVRQVNFSEINHSNQANDDSMPNQTLQQQQHFASELEFDTVLEILGASNENVGNPGLPRFQDLTGPIPRFRNLARKRSGNKDWQQTITYDLRNYLVHKLVEAVFPTSGMTTTRNERMSNLISSARNVEDAFYEMAKSRSEYYCLLIERICAYQKRLEEQQLRQRRKEQQQANVNQLNWTEMQENTTNANHPCFSQASGSNVMQFLSSSQQNQMQDSQVSTFVSKLKYISC